MKKALFVTRVSGFVPQHEMNDVMILQEMGYEIHYATNYHTVVYGKDNRRLDGTGIIRHQIDFSRSPLSNGIKKTMEQLRTLLLEEHFDLIHCHMPISAALARVVAQQVRKKTGREVPVLYTAHGFHFSKDAPLKNWLYYPIEYHLSRYTDRLILLNQEDYKRALRFPIRGTVEKINGVGLRLERFIPFQKREWGIYSAPPMEEIENIREKYGIPFDHYILVTVGELTANKNHRIIIDALKELKDLKISCLICGEGPMLSALQEQIKRSGLESRVILAGYVTQVPQILQQCDCFVFPSYREGLPVALMEAMAVGLPVVTSDVRGIADLLEHHKGGYMVHGFVAKDYAKRIRRMFEEKPGSTSVPRVVRRRQMGQWNMERIKDFSLDVVDAQMRAIYQSVDND